MSVGTQSDDDFGIDEIGLRRPEMSKDLQEVYDTLMNYQKRDSSTIQSISLAPKKQSYQAEESFDNNSDRLSDILAAYGVRPDLQGSDSIQKQATKLPKNPIGPSSNQNGQYFIPVDYETYSKWMAEKEQPNRIKPTITKSPNLAPAPAMLEGLDAVQVSPNKIDNLQNLTNDDGDDDTSQDAADLTTQESNKDQPEEKREVIEANVQVIGHLDRFERNAPQNVQKSPPPRFHEFHEDSHQPKSKQTLPETETEVAAEPIRKQSEKVEERAPLPVQNKLSKHLFDKNEDLEIVERDENFVIESDDIDEKLYSSESESLAKEEKRNPLPVKKFENQAKTTSLKKPAAILSSPSSSSSDLKPKMDLKKSPKVMTLQLQTESESSEQPQNFKNQSNENNDMSGPEMDDVDDFWN